VNAQLARIRDVKLVHDGERQSVLIEFNDGKVRSFSAKELYEATGFMGQALPDASFSASHRRAAEIQSLRRGRR
jgi:hypothetical protein